CLSPPTAVRTATAPSMMMKNESPGSPTCVTTVPAGASANRNEEGRMRTMLAMAIAVSLVAGMLSAASAADEKKANLQQERMKACNAPRRGPRRATSAQLARVLQGLLAVREAEGILKEQAASPWLFVGGDGGSVTPGAFWQNIWRPLLRWAGLRYRKPH